MGGMAAERSSTFILADVATGATGFIAGRELLHFTERHTFAAALPELTTGQDVERLARKKGAAGVVFMLEHGAPGRAVLRQAARLLTAQHAVYFYWPAEQAVEVIDRERLNSFWRLWLTTRFYQRWRRWRDRRKATRAARPAQATLASAQLPAVAVDTSAVTGQAHQIAAEAAALRAHNQGSIATLRGLAAGYEGTQPVVAKEMAGSADYIESGMGVLDRIEQYAQETAALAANLSPAPAPVAATPPSAPPSRGLDVTSASADVRALIASAAPVPLAPKTAPTANAPLDATGMYARLDFWAPLTSGGSYGHTVYQAKALSRTTRDFVCVCANPFRTLDQLGVRQVVVPAERREGNETNIVDANRFYYERLYPLIAAVRPAFVFERLVLGNYVIAKICKELSIPFIAEYNGSEISMMRSFSGKGYEHEEFYLDAEEFCFKQATLVSVISEHVGADVIKRGVARSRVLVNPNAVELDAYAPAAPVEKTALRARLGFTDAHRVIGFIGTFGGWHGVDVLAATMHKILARAPEARFLLIGDGNLKHLVLAAIAKHKLEDRVVDTGRVPQNEGARLLKACDVLVSPHSSHMVDSKFFGSPTKLFEYMAMSAGIVASDLEQIGEVLTPALRLSTLRNGHSEAGANRALLCKPGDEQEFVEATVALIKDAALAAALGKNARAAAERYYTWDQHVADLWAVLSGSERRGFHADLLAKGIWKANS